MRIFFSFLSLTLSFLCTNININNNKSYIVMDINSKRIIKECNKDEKFLTASISKVLTAICAIEYGYLDSYIEITDLDNMQEGSKVYIDTGNRLRLYDCIQGLIKRSGNDLAHAIAINVSGSIEEFVYLMNEKAKEIGMQNSFFNNPSGLDSINENISTAYDMALLISYCYQNEVFKEIFESTSYSFQTVEGNRFIWQNKHKLVDGNDIFVGGKTGYTKKSGRTLITTARNNGQQFVCVSFNISDDYNLHRNLLKESLNQYKTTLILASGIINPSIDISYKAYLKEDIYIPLNEKEKVIINIYLNKEEMEICGYLEVIIDKLIVYKTDIYNAKYIDIDESIIYIVEELYD